EFHDLGYNYHEEYHNYSLLWDESCYSVYLDGYLICRTSYFYGTSSVPEDVRLTINPRFNPDFDHDDTREMFVDYVRIWQKAEN
ncbi:MAG: hypothetical protein J5494_02890, partial [Candidatus Methanomethylophilaceae archaeon]|nr:hypothetical protein [Candidatus Methanomethylophilaceae archaeon]